METERDRLVDRIQVAQSQPSHLARTALLKRMYGRHPYAVQTPDPDQVRAVRPAALRRLHAERVHPAGAVLVLVGDVQPERALDAAEQALAGWRGDGHVAELPPAPPLEPGPLLLVDRPGSVQSSLRLALPAVPRTHPDHAALQLANLIFGGYFSSRWVENIREDKGYTYGPHSLVEHSVAGSVLIAGAEVATEVTAAALVETNYELGRLATRAAEGRRAGAGPPVRARHASARHVDPGRARVADQRVRRQRAAAGLPRRARRPARRRDSGRRGRGGRPLPGARPARSPSCSATPSGWPTRSPRSTPVRTESA